MVLDGMTAKRSVAVLVPESKTRLNGLSRESDTD
jgi:hypothetical protein